MGVVNVTPDSFSDGGRFLEPDAAAAHALRLAAEGADLLALGGESTRPGAAEVPAAEELGRVVPVVERLRAAGCTVPISVDTRKPEVARAALDAGADLVNDVSALADERLLELVAACRAPGVLMHMRGTPETMRDLACYGDVVAEVRAELQARVLAALAAGVRPERIALDPGIGFAKTHEQGAALLRGLGRLAELGFPLLVGVSRKGMIGRFGAEPVPRRRAPGSIAAGLFALSRGAAMLRVHDVAETVQAVRVWRALAGETEAFAPAPGQT
jgi:dihydropteroate synthase